MADYSQDLINFLKRTEGYAPTAKWDVRQYSGGYGTRALPGETFTPEKAEQRLREELDTVQGYLDKNVKVPMSDGQRSGLLSFGYNLGVDDIGKLLPDINSGDWGRVSQRMLGFNKALNKETGELEVLDGLTSRRQNEATFVNGGIPPNASAPSTKTASEPSPIWGISKDGANGDPNMLNFLAALGGSGNILAGLGKGLGLEGMSNAGNSNSIFGSLASMFGGDGGDKGGGGQGDSGALAQNAMTSASGGMDQQQSGLQRKPIDLAMLSQILKQRSQLGAGQSKGLGV